MLQKTSNSSAPGLSNIGYTIIKKLGKKATKLLLDLLNTILMEGEMPKKWKVGMIFPIPKMAEWDLQLENSRLIMLLEAARKGFIRIIQGRLSDIIIAHNILRGPNFTGLQGECTQDPIHIMNALIEAAKQENKEIWITLIDIKKAFDTVDLKRLQLALKRIKLPEKLEKFLVNMFTNRRVKVITKFRLTEGFSPGRGIDQREVIFLLLWRIYFDLLLCKLHKCKQGAKARIEWPIEITQGKIEQEKIQVAGLAYADDTALLANSKESIQILVYTAESFF